MATAVAVSTERDKVIVLCQNILVIIQSYSVELCPGLGSLSRGRSQLFLVGVVALKILGVGVVKKFLRLFEN